MCYTLLGHSITQCSYLSFTYVSHTDPDSTVTYLQVEIEVPQMCKFIMRTTECALSEVSVMDPQGQPVYRPAPGSEAFRAAMEKLVKNILYKT